MGLTFGTMDLYNMRAFLTRVVAKGTAEEDILVDLVSRIDCELHRRQRGTTGQTERTDRISA